jgi:hypothetical protein
MLFHAPMGRFQLELFIFITYFSTVVPLTSCVLIPVDLSSSMRHFQQVQARRQKKLQHPTTPVENFALTTKGLQYRQQLGSGTTVEK